MGIYNHDAYCIERLETLLKAYCEEDNKKEGKEKLVAFLSERPMEEIQLIQILMYIGRTGKVLTGKTRTDAVNEMLEAFGMMKGWRPKEIEIDQMIYDIPLATYYSKGKASFQEIGRAHV